MYRLVADIPRYPEFLRWCKDARIESEQDNTVIASITISFKGLDKTFTTRNTMHPEEGIDIRLVRGPFSELEGLWRFTPLAQDASKIELDLCFAFRNAAVSRLVGPVFSYIANGQVDAFHQRARQLYG